MMMHGCFIYQRYHVGEYTVVTFGSYGKVSPVGSKRTGKVASFSTKHGKFQLKGTFVPKGNVVFRIILNP